MPLHQYEEAEMRHDQLSLRCASDNNRDARNRKVPLLARGCIPPLSLTMTAMGHLLPAGRPRHRPKRAESGHLQDRGRWTD
jgi:hypothetical protein